MVEKAEKKTGGIVQKVMKFAGVGIVCTLLDYLVYQMALNLIFQGNLALSAVTSGVISTFAAYVMHNNITWKERDPGKYGVIKFFIWNGVTVFLLRPPLTWFFSLFGFLYGFVYWLTSWIFTYDFVASTGVYLLMTTVTMVLNYTVYEKLVFAKEQGKGGKKVDVKGIGQAREETKGKGKGKKQG